MLAASGIDQATLKSAEPTWLPPTGFDRRFGWRGFYPQDPKTEMEISAASYRGKPVYFHVIGPWSTAWRMQTQRPLSRASVVRETTFLACGFITLVVAALFARRNIRMGRVSALLTSWPITVDFSQWYSAQSLFMFAVFLALLFYGFRIALGNKPLWSEA